MKKLAVRLLILIAIAGVIAGGYYLVQQIPKEESEIALAPVRRGDLIVRTFLRGELQTVRSLTLTAPNLGSVSQITRLAPNGALARPGNLIAEFDDSDRRIFLEDAMLDVQQIQQDLKKAETELEIRKSQDQVELIRAQFAVRRAELEVKRNELISAIDARKNILTLEEAKRRQEKLEQDIKSRLQQREAELAVLREQINKAQLDVRREQRRIAEAQVLTPMSGLVSILENRAGGRGGFGQTTPQIREGDQIPPGMAITQVLDLSEMDLVTKVEEVERANLREGQEALIRLDALPGQVVHGKIKRLGNTAETNVFRGEATKKFECILSVDMGELLKHVGASPEQVRRILATARENAERGLGSRPVPRGGAAAGMAGAAPGGASPAASAAGPTEQARNRRASAGGPTEEQRQQAREKMQELLGGRDMQSLSEEERQQIRRQMQQALGGSFGRRQGPGGPGRSRGQDGGEAGPPAMLPGAPQAPAPSRARFEMAKFTEQDRRNAELPSPPEEGSDVEILLRPGLLADAEIIIERIPDVIHVPYQGVFDVAGNTVVYVKDGDRFETRRVKIGRRSESRIVILEGLKEGEMIALESPQAARESRTKKSKKAPGKQGSTPAIPGAAGGPGGAPEGPRRKR